MSTRVTFTEDVSGSYGTFKEGDTFELDDTTAADIIGATKGVAADDQPSDNIPLPADVAISAAAGSANIAEVTFQVKDLFGDDYAEVTQLDIWLSDAATGTGHTGTTASGTTAAKTSCGLVIDTQVTKKALRVQTTAAGLFTLQITDTAKTHFYPCCQVPGTGRTVVGTQLTTGNYG